MEQAPPRGHKTSICPQVIMVRHQKAGNHKKQFDQISAIQPSIVKIDSMKACRKDLLIMVQHNS